MSRYFDANNRTSLLDPQTSGSSGSEQVGAEEKSELRLAQLQHQLPLNEPTALMHLVEDAAGKDDDDDEDEDTRECKKLFKNMKFFLSREVRFCSILWYCLHKKLHYNFDDCIVTENGDAILRLNLCKKTRGCCKLKIKHKINSKMLEKQISKWKGKKHAGVKVNL